MRTWRFIAVPLVLMTGSGCRLIHRMSGTDDVEPSVVKADAPKASDQLLKATIAEGKLWTHGGQEQASQVEAEINNQLQYAVGQLDGIGGVADLTRLELAANIPAGAPPPMGWQVSYTARFAVAWPAGKAPPPSLILTLPRGGDVASRTLFFQAFAATCADDPAAADVYTVFWYHYRPEKNGCPLATGDIDKALASHAALALQGKAAAPVALVPPPPIATAAANQLAAEPSK